MRLLGRRIHVSASDKGVYMKNSLFEIASKIDTPLAIIGISIVILYFIYKAIIQKNIYSQLREKNTFKIFEILIRYVFIFAVIALVVGTASYVTIEILKISKTEQSPSNPKSVPTEKLIPIEKNHGVINKQSLLFLPFSISTVYAAESSIIQDSNSSSEKDNQQNGKRAIKSKNSRVTIIHTVLNETNIFPVISFTLMNRAKESKVINSVTIDVIEYHPYMSIPQTRLLEPIAVWDIVLPFGSGRYTFAPATPLLIAQDDAATVDLRFFCEYEGKKIPPSETAVYILKIIFNTDQGDEVISKKIRL